MAREFVNQNCEGFQIESRGAVASTQLQLDAHDSSWVVAQRSAVKLPSEFDNGLQLVTERHDKPDYLHSIDKAGVTNPFEAAELTAGFATSFASGVYNNIRFLADEGFVKLGQGIYGAGAVAIDYYTHTSLSTIGRHAREASNWTENQSCQWLYNYSHMDAWHRGEEIGKISSLFLPYGAGARGKVLADLEASVARNGAMLGVEGAAQLDCSSAAKAGWLRDLWKKVGKGQKSAESGAEHATGAINLTAREIMVRELFGNRLGNISEQLVAEVQEGLRSIPQRDLQDLLTAKWKVELSETLATYDSKLAKEPIAPESPVLHEQMNALTIPERLRIIVPEMTRNLKGELLSNVGHGADLVRHEVGHVLCEQRGWMQNHYLREAFMREGSELLGKAKSNPGSVYEKLANDLFKRPNPREEVLCNLYADAHGGCGFKPDLESAFRASFKDTARMLSRLN